MLFLVAGLLQFSYAQETTDPLVLTEADFCYREFRFKPPPTNSENFQGDLTQDREVCAPDWDVSALFGVGVKTTLNSQQYTPGLTARVRLNFRHKDFWHSELKWDATYDHEPEKADPDRLPLWHDVEWKNDLKIVEGANFRVGWNVDTRAIENTASSVEKSLFVGTGPEVTFFLDRSKDFQISMGAGVFTKKEEIDDDVPRARGFGREALQYNGSGPYCSVEFMGKLDSKNQVGVAARLLWDAEANRVREIPVALQYRRELTGLARLICGRYLSVEGGVRYYEDRNLLGEEIEGFAAIMFER